MNTDKHSASLGSEHRHGTGHTTPSRGTQSKRSGSADELAAVSPLLQQLARQAPPEVSARQWREFSMELADKVDRELEGKSTRKLSEKLRDQVSATDSNLLRAGIVLIAVVLLALLAFVTWVLTTATGQSFFDDPAVPMLTSLRTVNQVLATI